MTSGAPHVAHHGTNWMTRRCGPYRIAGLIASSPQSHPCFPLPPSFHDNYQVRSICSAGLLIPRHFLPLPPISSAQATGAVSTTPQWQSSMNRPPRPSLLISRHGLSKQQQRWALCPFRRLEKSSAQLLSRSRFRWMTMRSPLVARSNPWVLLQLRRKAVSTRERRL
jgi:hypothetical protein